MSYMMLYIYIYCDICVYVIFHGRGPLWVCYPLWVYGDDTWDDIGVLRVLGLNTKLIRKIKFYMFWWWYDTYKGKKLKEVYASHPYKLHSRTTWHENIMMNFQ